MLIQGRYVYTFSTLHMDQLCIEYTLAGTSMQQKGATQRETISAE